ncbi:MAG: DUF438 domain-containing protein [Candidatus Hodarchaeota archaeon]
MTELFESQKKRRETLKGIIRDLHAGVGVEDVKDRFKNLLKDVGSSEIAQIEQELIEEGLPEDEVKRLCDVHVAVFKEGLETQISPETIPGHPVHVFEQENRAIEAVIVEIQSLLEQLKSNQTPELLLQWKVKHNQLMDIEKHFLRKENLLFPFLEKHGFTGPSKVMWALHDDIRAELKEVSRFLNEETVTTELIEETVLPMMQMITDLIYKEEKILFPTSIEKLTEKQWVTIARQSDGIGYCLVAPGIIWKATTDVSLEDEEILDKKVRLSTGHLVPEQLELIFSHLPVDLTFINENDQVVFFSTGPERIFHRTKAIIGRKVQNCHPPKSVHVVNQILEEFKSKKRDIAEFWINPKENLIHIRYFAIRDTNGNYKGTLEMTQNVTDIRELKGEKRLLDS